LNQLVDDAFALKGLISEQPVGTPDPAADYIQFYDVSDAINPLKRCLLVQAPAGVTSFAITMPTSVFDVTVTNPSGPNVSVGVNFDLQAKNTFLAGPISGANVAPAFRAIKPVDLASQIAIPAADIDFTQAAVFTFALTANKTFHLINGVPGQTIRVALQQTGASNWIVNWDAPSQLLLWPGGIQPVMTVGANRLDLFEFTFIGAGYLGSVIHDFRV
jgi:hypothetical protein